MQLDAYLPDKLRYSLYDTLYYKPVIRRRGLSCELPPLFSSIFFEVVTRCNSRCEFCSASIQNEKRPATEMPFELFKKAVDELASLNYSKRVAFHVNNEPLLFDGLETFLTYAREKLPRSWLQIMSNGIALSPQRGEALIQAGVDELTVDFYRESPQQKPYKNLERFRTEILSAHFPVQNKHVYSNRNGSRQFHFRIINRQLTEVLTSRGGNAPNKLNGRFPSGFCIYPWAQFNVTTDGRVSKCCSDFYFADPMGNLQHQGIMDIWHGKAFAHVRKNLWQGQRAPLPNCKDCDFFGIKNAHIANPLLRAVKYSFLKSN